MEILEAVQDSVATQKRVISFSRTLVHKARARLQARSKDQGLRNTQNSHDSLTRNHAASDAGKPPIVAGNGKPKGILRIIEKLATESQPEKAKDVRYLMDLARNEITSGTVVGIEAVLQELLEAHAKNFIRLVRFKNRFQQPTLGGWADIVVNLFFLDDPRLHVFELQLVHEKLSVMRKQIGGHSDYTCTRAATEICLMQETQKKKGHTSRARSKSLRAALESPLGPAIFQLGDTEIADPSPIDNSDTSDTPSGSSQRVCVEL